MEGPGPGDRGRRPGSFGPPGMPGGAGMGRMGGGHGMGGQFGMWGGPEMERQDPEMFKLMKEDDDLDRQTREVAMRHRRAPTEERVKIKQQLTDLVGKQFEVRQQRRMLELKRVEEELKRLREAIDRRKEARDSLVNKRVQQLIGEDMVDF